MSNLIQPKRWQLLLLSVLLIASMAVSLLPVPQFGQTGVVEAQTTEDLTAYPRTDTLGTTTSVREIFVWVYDADTATYTDETTDANDSGTNDFPLIASVATEDPYGDCTYFGANGQFSFLSIDTGTAGAGYDAADIVWEYWNGSAWTSLAGISDATNGFTTTTQKTVSWTCPTDWDTCQVNEIDLYWIRARFADGPGTEILTTQPLGDQIWRGGRLFVTPDRVRATGVTFDEDTYLCKSRTVNSSTTNVNDYFSVTFDAITGGATATFALYSIWTLTQGVDDLNALDVASESWLNLHVVETDALSQRLRIRQCYRGALTTSTDYVLIELNRRYYINVSYDKDVGTYGTLYAYVYYDKAMTQSAGTVSLALSSGQETYSHYGPAWSSDSGQSGTISYVLGDVYLDEAPDTSMFAESNISFPMNWTDEDDLTGFPTGWTTSDEGAGTIEGANWPGTSTNSAHLIANEATGNDVFAYVATSSSAFARSIVQMDVYLDSLGDGKKRYFGGIRDNTDSYGASVLAVRSGANYYWRIGYRQNVSTQTTNTLAVDTEYTAILGLCHVGDATELGAVLFVKGGAYTEFTLVDTYNFGVASTTSFNGTQLFVGNRYYAFTSNEGGACYVKNIKYHDGGTWGPKLARGGANDGTLVYTHRVTSTHFVDYGNSFIEIFSSTDDGDTWTYQSALGPTANTDYQWAFVVWDSINSEWLFFLKTTHTADGAQTTFYHTSDLSNLGAAEWTADDTQLYPSRMIEGGQLLVGKLLYDGSAPFASISAHYATVELGDDYTLTTAATISDNSLGYTSLVEPFIYRRYSDNQLMCVLRYDSSGPRDEMLHVDISAGGDGTAWSGAIWAGEDYSDISANLSTFVFMEKMYIVGRDSQKQPWQSLIWQTNSENGQLVSERVWSDVPGQAVLWECGNGAIDAALIPNNHYQDVAFVLGIASFRQIDVIDAFITPDISNTPSSHDYRTVVPSATYWANGAEPGWPLADGNCTGNVTNNSSFAVDIYFSMGNMTGGTQWTIGASPDTNVFRMRVYISGAGNSTVYTTLSATPQMLIGNLTADASEFWEFVLDTPTNDPFSDGATKTGTITLAAEAH
jgi:hypothetical protein